MCAAEVGGEQVVNCRLSNGSAKLSSSVEVARAAKFAKVALEANAVATAVQKAVDRLIGLSETAGVLIWQAKQCGGVDECGRDVYRDSGYVSNSEQQVERGEQAAGMMESAHRGGAAVVESRHGASGVPCVRVSASLEGGAADFKVRASPEGGAADFSGRHRSKTTAAVGVDSVNSDGAGQAEVTDMVQGELANGAVQSSEEARQCELDVEEEGPFSCDFDCGFVGSYEQVAEHEMGCSLREEQRAGGVIHNDSVLRQLGQAVARGLQNRVAKQMESVGMKCVQTERSDVWWQQQLVPAEIQAVQAVIGESEFERQVKQLESREDVLVGRCQLCPHVRIGCGCEMYASHVAKVVRASMEYKHRKGTQEEEQRQLEMSEVERAHLGKLQECEDLAVAASSMNGCVIDSSRKKHVVSWIVIGALMLCWALWQVIE